jgi:hypothetical protein
LGGKEDEKLIEMFRSSIRGMENNLIKTSAGGLRYLTDSGSSRGNGGGKMEHLACFVPGLLALGIIHDDDNTLTQADKLRQLQLAEDLGESCYAMYERSATGLSAEGVYFMGPGQNTGIPGNPDFKPISGIRWNILRPETVESLMLLFMVTGDEKYREWSFKIFEAFEKNSKTKYGYGAHPDVFNGQAGICCKGNDDKQETFWSKYTHSSSSSFV